MGERIAIVVLVYVVVVIPNIIYGLAWDRQLDKLFDDEGED